MSNQYIALLRGINVGGNNLIKMAELKAICAGLGYKNVVTYIQSGNVILESDKTDAKELGIELTLAIEKSHGFAPQLFMFKKQEIVDALDGFDLAYDEEKFVYFYFLEQVASQADLQLADGLKLAGDEYKLTDEVLYLHCPEGIGRSKLAVKLGQLLGVKTTARNLRTVKKLIELAG